MMDFQKDGWDDYPGHIFPKIVDGTSEILKALGVGKMDGSNEPLFRAGGVAGSSEAAGRPSVAAERPSIDGGSGSDDSESSDEAEEEDPDAVDRSIGEGRALLCGFDWLVRRRNGELWPMLLEINTSPQLMYATKIGGQEWIDVLQRMMADFVKLIVKPALKPGVERELGRWVPCETLPPVAPQ